MNRGTYGEINRSEVDADMLAQVRQMINNAAAADKVDEHGSWDFRAEFDRRGRGQSLNWDLYGVGYDVHTGELLAVIQVRQFERRYKNGYPNIRKNYFLIGRNEDGTTFAHAVSHAPIFAAIKKDKDVVLAVQNWIFGGSYADMVRQGDLCLLPLTVRPAGSKGQMRRTAILEGSHRLTATQVAEVDGRLYAKNPHLTHLPGTHPDVEAGGWCRIMIGRRAEFWHFAAPTID